MRAFYFGPPNGRLFGAYHAPEGTPLSRGVVICQPHGHEYVRTHRALRNLAVLLSQQGHAVLRFDYYGAGDSDGDSADASVDQWIADISLAADELRRTARVARVSLVGVRLGAALAASAAAARTDVDALVLWDPVVRGREYTDHLVRLHAQWLAIDARQESPDAGASAPLGFPLPPVIRDGLARVDAGQIRLSPATRVQVVLSGEHVVDPDWRALLVAAYGRQALTVVPTAADWEKPESVHTAISPQPVLHAIAARLEHALPA
jgi:uncharacterized protein